MSTRPPAQVESPRAWLRLFTSLALMTIGGSGMYAVIVVLPLVQVEFSITRSVASLPYTVTMVGFGLGGIFMGRLSDRYGVIVPVLIGALSLGLGFIAASAAPGILVFALVQGIVIGFLGSSATFAPLVADISFWFTRRRGIAVAICISGNYLAGATWPPILQYFFDAYGSREEALADAARQFNALAFPLLVYRGLGLRPGQTPQLVQGGKLSSRPALGGWTADRDNAMTFAMLTAQPATRWCASGPERTTP